MILRVFPSRTRATPIDSKSRIDTFPGLFDDADEIHISVTFTWDIPRAEELEHQWERIAPVKVGGPAMGSPAGEFTPGKYLKPGYTFTSRGCPNACDHCLVPEREGPLVELPITPGWNILDSNLLACSDAHIEVVFKMLGEQKHQAEFTGGLEASRLTNRHIDLLMQLKPKQVYCAYDDPAGLEPLQEAGRMFERAGWGRAASGRPNSRLRAFVLCGYDGDTIPAAEKRMVETVQAGFMPAAMLFRDVDWTPDDIRKRRAWHRFQRTWFRPAATATAIRTATACEIKRLEVL